MNLHDQDNFRRDKKEGYIAGISHGIQQAKIETAKSALAMNLPLEQIEKLTGLTIDTIKTLN